VVELLLLLLAVLPATIRNREDVVPENLLPRHQVAVLTRPTRKAPRLSTPDRLFWAFVLRRDWRRHLLLVQPRR
jgi:hypothetical protein